MRGWKLPCRGFAGSACMEVGGGNMKEQRRALRTFTEVPIRQGIWKVRVRDWQGDVILGR